MKYIKSIHKTRTRRNTKRLAVFTWRRLHNLTYKQLFIIVFILGAISVALWKITSSPKVVKAGWWNDSWHYRQTIPITSSSGTNRTNLLFKLFTNYDISALITANKLQSNLNDLRFVDSSGIPIKYWIEDATTNSIDIWIILPSLPSTGTSIYMYYGNPDAGPGNDVNTVPSGGNVSMVGSDRVHTFLSSGTFVSNVGITVQSLIVAGGGGGGMDMGGGGGGGGVIYNAANSINPGNYPVVVGAGGSGAPAAGTNGQPAGHQYTISATNGQNSSFNSQTAIGGGYGASSYYGYTPNYGVGGSGGSGGGASGYSDGTIKASAGGVAGQGYGGGQGGGQYYSGGGGGAGGAGTNSTAIANGGVGVQNSINGTAYYWAGGGGGAGYSQCGGNGGAGGGGGAAVCTTTGGSGLNPGSAGGGGVINSQTNMPGGNAGANTGGGGGGGSHYNANNKGGDGGSGIVIIRYSPAASLSVGSPATEEKGLAPVVYYSFDEANGTTIHNQLEKNGEYGLVSWWKFDEGVGTTVIDEMRRVTGTFSATPPTWTTSSKSGNALSFNGSNNWVTLPASSAFDLQQFSISAWTYSTNYNQNGFVFEKTTNGSVNTQYSCFFNATNTFYFRTINSVGTQDDLTFTTSSYVTNSAWNHVVCSYNGYFKKIFVNGVEVASKAYSQTLMTNPAGTAFIGAYGSGAGYPFSGSMDNVKIYNRGLTVSEAAADYASMQGSMINYGINGIGATWIDGGSSNNQRPLGKALSFNGTNQYVIVPNTNALKIAPDVSMEAWINPNTSGNSVYRTILAKRDASSVTNYEIYLNNAAGSNQGALSFYNGTQYVSSYIPPVNKWTHVAATISGTSLILYANGQAVYNTTISALSSSSNGSFAIGKPGDAAAAEYFSGAIDEVKIFNYTLSANQIKTEYNRSGSSTIAVAKKIIDPGTANLIAWWKMDEGSGLTVSDSSGNNNNGIYSGTVSSDIDLWNPGKIGKSLNFNGSSNVVTIPDSPSLKGMAQLTQEAWVYIRSFATGPVIMGKVGSYDLYFNTSGVLLTDYKSCTGTQIQLNTWTHIAMTYDGSYTRLYVNGVQVGMQANSGAIGTSTNVFEIGRWSGSTEYVNGLIDNVKVYNKALSSGEIMYEFSQGGPALYYSFDEGGGTTIHNQVENNGEYGLVSWYKMDEASWAGTAGEVRDVTGNNHGVRLGNSTTTAAAKIGYGGTFDGVGDGINIGTSASLDFGNNGPFTFSGWIKPAALVDYAAFVSKDTAGRNSPYSYMTVFMANGRLSAYNSSAWVDICPAGSIAAGNWYHVAFAYNGTTLTGYVNGSACGSAAFTYPDNAAYEVDIGSWYSPSTAYDFNGTMDNVKIYNRALSGFEIAADYTSTQGTLMNYGNGGVGATWPEGARRSANQKPLGTSLSFNGSSNYISAPDSDSLDPALITVNFWIYPTSFANSPVVISHGNNTNGWYVQLSAAGKIYFCSSNSCKVTTNGTLTTGSWQHVSITHDGSNDKFYVNGALTDTIAQTTAITNYAGNFIVGNFSSGSYYFAGSLDEIKIYPYAFTQTDVNTEYNRSYVASFGAAKNESDPVKVSIGTTSSLMGWWKFDEGSANTAYDSSGNNNTVLLENSPVWTQGKFGHAIQLNGSTQRGNAGSNLNSSTISIEAWVYRTSATVNQGIVRKDPVYAMSLYNNTVQVAPGNNWAFYDTGQSIPLNTWTHLTFTYDGATMKFYKNGILSWSTALSGTLPSNANPTYIGYDANNWWWAGNIDQVKIYNRALTASEVVYDYSQGKPLAQWRFDEKSGNIAYDDFENNLDGTLGTGNSAPVSVAGKFNNAFSFDGSNDYIRVPSSTLLNDPANLSVSVWVKTNDASQDQTIVSRNGPFFLRISANRFRVGIYSGAWTFVNGTIPLVNNTWYHLVLTYDGAFMKSYVNGILDTNNAKTGNLAAFGDLYFGYPLAAGENYPFNGIMDEVRIYNYPLTINQIKLDYNNNAAARL